VEPEPTAARYRSDQALDGAVEALTTAICNRLAERYEAPRRGLPAPRPAPQPGVYGPPEALCTLPAEAALQHPAVVHRLQLCDAEIARLRYSLVQAAGLEAGRAINIGASGALRGPEPGPASAPPALPPPPWSERPDRP
jgi:hypothetical protein